MRRGWLIYDTNGIKINSWFAEHLKKCLENVGLIVEIKLTDGLKYGYKDGELCFFENGSVVLPPEFAVVRTIDPLLSEQLESVNVRVFNSAYTSRICNDKRSTHQVISQTGIPMTDSIFCDKRYFSAESITFPCVCKSASGHGGKEVFMVNDHRELEYALEKIAQNEFILQRPVSDLGEDVRVYVLGDEVITCAKRLSQGDFRSNFSLGGTVRTVDDENIKRYALKAAKHVKADFVGVDFIFDNGNPLLNEIEDVVGTRMIYATTDVDICVRYSEYIKERLDNEADK